jgi:hypothetical protein
VLSPGGEDILMTRPHVTVEVAVLPGGALALLAALGKGQALGEAAEVVSDATPDFDLAAALAPLLANGAFAALL